MITTDIDASQNQGESAQDIAWHTSPMTDGVSNPYFRAATSDNTRKAYRSDIKHFEQAGGLLPATPDKIIHYLKTFADKLNPRTLSRRLVALKHWHTYQGFPDPTAHPAVMKTMVGITRVHGRPKDKAPPLSPDDMLNIVQTLAQSSSLMSLRDSALLQIGYFGAMRRSEIIQIHYEHIAWQKEGIEILLPLSKTDPAREGQYCAIPYGHDLLCPVSALKNWLEKSHIDQGPVFRRIIHHTKISDLPLTPLSVNHIIHRCAKRASLPNADEITPHSLRRGLATYAARAQAPIQAIMRAGRWKQVNTVMEYVEASERFSDSAASSVLVNMQNGFTTES